MTEIMIDTEWTFDNVPDRKKKKYRGKYLYIYSSAAKFFNDGMIDELNDRFNKEIGPLDDYDCPLYNNWMAVNMTEALAKSGVVRSDFFQFIFYDSDLVLNCATSDGVRIKMALVPGSEKILEEKDAKDNS